ncbi:MAG: NPCBM/NEW2 domain-containing protein [Planctomycetes bacterium]|nr:NPCBM/NEW2 domain-containing protein [Planctomycetota bacterium]
MNLLRSACILLALLMTVPSWADDLRTLDNKSLKGALEKITDKEITLNVDGKSVATPLSQALVLELRSGRALPAAGKYTEVQLLDDSILRCTKVTFGAKEVQLELTSGYGGKVTVPVAALLTVLREAQDEKLKEQFTKMLGDKRRKDRIFTLKDGNLGPLEGTLGAIDEAKQTIKFTLDSTGKEIDAPLANISALQFVRTDLPADPSLCKVIDIDGNVLVASKLAYAGGQVNVITPFNQKCTLDAKTIAQFDFNFGRLTYLSDLEPKMTETVFLGGFNPVRKDKNLDGDQIMLQDKKYEKGLSMYAGVDLQYALAGKYKDFKALLGVDTRIADEGQGDVTVTIYCDAEKRSTFKVSTKAPTPIAVNVKDVQTLRIVVSGSPVTNFGGHATLANAHVSQ